VEASKPIGKGSVYRLKETRSKEERGVMSARRHHTQDFDLERVMDEWRRLYDWAVLSRKNTALIEEVSLLGQQFSSTLNAYRHTKASQQRARLYRELKAVYGAMQALYDRLDANDRIPLSFPSNDF
jgi:hypothetical protein